MKLAIVVTYREFIKLNDANLLIVNKNKQTIDMKKFRDLDITEIVGDQTLGKQLHDIAWDISAENYYDVVVENKV